MKTLLQVVSTHHFKLIWLLDHFKKVINRPIKKVPSLRDITIANLVRPRDYKWIL